jgi:hypothetical protein
MLRNIKKREQCKIDQEKFVNHTQLFIDLVNWSHTKKLWGTFTFDSYFSNGAILNHINSLRDDHKEIRGYAGVQYCDAVSGQTRSE